MLINVLIYKIYVYDDNVTVIFTTQDKNYEAKISKINELECSYKENIAQPIKPLYEHHLLYWWICC